MKHVTTVHLNQDQLLTLDLLRAHYRDQFGLWVSRGAILKRAMSLLAEHVDRHPDDPKEPQRMRDAGHVTDNPHGK